MSYKSILLISAFLLYLPFILESKEPLLSTTSDLRQQAYLEAQAGCYEKAYELLEGFLDQKEEKISQLVDDLPKLKTTNQSSRNPDMIYGLLSLVLLFCWKGQGHQQSSPESTASVLKSPTHQESMLIQGSPSTFLSEAEALIVKHIEEEAFGVSALSRALHLSRSQLHRKIKTACNYTPSVFMRKIRLKEAKRLLEGKAGNISEVAIMVGMPNLAYFSRSFKSEFGYPPSQLLRKNKSD